MEWGIGQEGEGIFVWVFGVGDLYGGVGEEGGGEGQEELGWV